MAADRPSALATLDLPPGADAAAIDEAYRRLIKLHHPDRAGGDAERAAEINRAYFELRRRGGEPLLPSGGAGFAFAQPARRRRGPGLLLSLAVATGVIVVALYSTVRSIHRTLDRWTLALIALAPGDQLSDAGTARADLHAPLALAAIRAATGDAVRLSAGKDPGTLIEHSRTCHLELRSSPSLSRLDGCAAFDDAVVMIEDRDPIDDEGPFSAWSVTARQTRAAALLSDDYMAADSRLENIRVTVELALAAARPQPVQAKPVADPDIPPDRPVVNAAD